MKSIFKSALFLCLVTFLTMSCSHEDDSSTNVQKNLKVNNFIWKGLNGYYLWQAEVPNLSDERRNGLSSFLESYSDPEKLFQDLLNKPISKYPGGDAVDRFSMLVSDYTLLEQQLSGVAKNNGLNFNLATVASGSNDIVGIVSFVLPNSDASAKGIKRGDLFMGVNGTKLTDSNYLSLLSEDNYTLNLADYKDDKFVLNGKSVTLTKTVLAENPIFINKVISTGSHKIGYLMYNSFYAEYDDKLNEAFGELKAQGATDLVLDLRYNGGGAMESSAQLASLITGQFNNQVFGKVQYNTKNSASNDVVKFVNNTKGKALNSLNLSRVYVITTTNTASASELIINGLKPYINVVQIGETTHGKNVGSVVVYDSKNMLTKEGITSDHKYAMLPLVLKLTNSVNFGDYSQGLQPTYKQSEEINNYGILGEISEPLLNLAISKITGVTAKRSSNNFEQNLPYITDSKTIDGLNHGMYFEKLPAGLLK